MTGAFSVLGFPWPTDPGVVYVEYQSGALYLEQPAEIRAHVEAFERVCALALSPDDSVKMLLNIAEEYS
jgi:hypothetical protein